MSAMFSTTERLVRSGQAFSSRRGLVTALPEPQKETPAPVPESPAPFQYRLSAPEAGPIETERRSGGRVELRPMHDGTLLVRARAEGISVPPDPAVRPTLWLLHDLRVPEDLPGPDLSRLQAAGPGTSNRPGQIFSLEGGPAEPGSGFGVVTVPVKAGELVRQPDGSWRLDGRLDSGSNRSAHPLVLLGPTVIPSMNASLPSGTVAGLLTDLLLRQATLHPEYPMPDRYPERLAAVGARWLAHGQQAFLGPDRFNRAAVTLEGPVRHLPALVPSPGILLQGRLEVSSQVPALPGR